MRPDSVRGFVSEIAGLFPDRRLRQHPVLRLSSRPPSPHRNRRSQILASAPHCSCLQQTLARSTFSFAASSAAGAVSAATNYFDAFLLFFAAASRSAFLRRAARFLILSRPRLCPILKRLRVDG